MRARRLIPLLAAAVAVIVVVSLMITAVMRQEKCIELRMWTSEEKFVQLKDLTDGYGRSGRRVADRCVSVQLTINDSRGAYQALAGQPGATWSDAERPDIWSPSSSVWVERLRASVAERPGRVTGVGAARSLATTPVVIAMPQPMARALGWPETPIGWRDLLALARDPNGWGAKGHPEWGRFRFGKTNPLESTTGLLATVASASALSGAPSLTTDTLPGVAGDLRDLELATVHYGSQPHAFLGNLYNAAQEDDGLGYISAVALEEKVVLDYNQGTILDDPPRQETAPRQPLAAVFPSDGTIVQDHPALVLDAAWVTPERRLAAEDFLAFAGENAEMFTDAGFRDAEGKPGTPHTTEAGTVPTPVYQPVRTPDIGVIDGVTELWEQTRRRADVLVVMDTSASMNTMVEAAGRSKLALARSAAAQVPRHLTADDRVGLWEFSGELGAGPTPWRPLLAPGPVADVSGEFGSEVQALRAAGPTALYATTRAAVREMTARADPDRISAVILISDGENEYPADDNLETLLTGLSEQDPDRAVRVFTIAYGEEADAVTLGKISAATRALSYDATDPITIEAVMRDVLSNF
ncbi:substrate-binding domain-containing protein [Catenuloplanes atrovinosus]|uniref:Ca-activated chloride channel family protein n=1 Tax=Catenuloplanes atrovinosus TaxID=137266 RepID=A0AAE3YJT0_9ACTN|nr:substrate-binding domain-containing protein [Catenuloplanes atrovinosus]MDR7273669.1 Ca-activated chloride channel family protein [Catenuloplanes atrovinosus]